MAYQCDRCNHFTADEQKHECIYDEFNALKASFEVAQRTALELEIDLAEAKRGNWEVEMSQAITINKLRTAVSAAQDLMNHIQCYSTGVSVMAEEDMITRFEKYSNAVDSLNTPNDLFDKEETRNLKEWYIYAKEVIDWDHRVFPTRSENTRFINHDYALATILLNVLDRLKINHE